MVELMDFVLAAWLVLLLEYWKDSLMVAKLEKKMAEL
jgi:hypothetical protein